MMSREESLHAELREARAGLATIDEAMKTFRKEHSIVTDSFGRVLRVQTSELGGRAEIETAWKQLLTRRDTAHARFTEVLKEWADAKEAK